ncbi:hypothetical protein [Maribacter sp. Asnod2-G09]|uniref:hypothetical protein n=1 Tax=Maribacter sp. Asnod2-G09 TaxID=3160577 RepID=UPI0038688CFC
MDLEAKLRKIHKDIIATISVDGLFVNHPDFDFEIEFDRKDETDDELVEIVTNFFSYEYQEGQYIRKIDYQEIVIDITTYSPIWYDENFEIPTQGNIENKIHYQIGEISKDFEIFLKNNILWEGFDAHYFRSLKIYSVNTQLKLSEKKDLDKAYMEILNSIFFDLHYKNNLKLSTIDLSDLEKYDFDNHEEPEIEDVEDTSVVYGKYDTDLVSYYNRAVNMSDSEFKYLAYFQVLECIFDEVYKYETIEDVKGILQSNWFSNRKNEDIGAIIDIVDRYNKDKNDRNKTKLVLDKFFKGELHDEAYFLVNKEISELLFEMKLFQKESELKDCQKLANIIYDFRCECTHSNRSYPIKNTTVISNDNLSQYLLLIRKVSERIILNYGKSST